MRSRILPVVGIGAIALVAAAAFSSPAIAGGHGGITSGHQGKASHFQGDATRPTCYSNLIGDVGEAETSQNFEASFDAYDASGAQAFTLRNKCLVTEVAITGQYSIAGPADSETVTFYNSDHGQVGSVRNTQTVTGTDTAGSFIIPLQTVHLQPGRYWIGVQINLDFATGGQWYWETSSNQPGLPAQWENPGDGFGTGCTTWGNMQNCLLTVGTTFQAAIYH